ncbi:hypothetical protein JTE90_017361 [Oedothorax gibbosus]|uniref:C2H2-type domain-containing protein n=1 Tax=Oedothorax gibbosus TaxID=931172 RepID=A0AAV6VP89_9ARAC|nr:hypothetical protein JTE90_017361 [Oedothorax gibbosus]
MTCCYCKRKFTRLLLFRQHKKTCQKGIQKKKVLKKIFIKNKLKAFGVISKTKDKKTQSKKPSKPSTIACPKCMKLFSSKSEYNAHSRKDSCSETSARKSFSSSTPKQPVPKVSHKEPSASSSQAKKDGIEILDSGIGVSCKWCKNMYPNQKILAKHLERSSLCASALHKQIYKEKKPVEHTARKTMQKCARKSFKRVAPQVDTRSARKSLPGPSRNRYAVDPSPLKSLNQCPVCYQKIPDPYKFFQHQKKLNHWGRATKAMNNKCKCPFCGKQFYQVRLLHAHVRNHANKSKPEIEFFLKKTTCAICAQIFGSETAKYQHMRYFHSKSSVDGSPKVSDSSSYNSLPLAVKQKLRLHPNTCPICSKEFPATYFRNKHFQENHLDAELECKFCKEKFNTVESLDNHMHDAHYDDFQFECLFCKINLATASHVVLHCTKVHSNQDPNKIIRSREDKTLVRAPGFEYPVQVGEEGSNVFYCDICDIHFLKKAGLQSHRQSKQHKDTVVQNLEKMEKSYAELPSPKRASKVKKATPDILTCSECSQDFASVKDFVPHRLGHFGKGKYLKISDLNLYTCEICGEVSNSHSKVQMHLFWHLQVNSTTTEKTSGKGKTDPIVPDRLSGQLVAKKSFGKSESQQEIVIGGVKKSLFTCENCSISFTTKSHYSLHVRKLCKKKPSVDKTKTQNVANSASSSKKKVSSHPKPLSEEEDDSSSSEEFKSTILCTICNCLFLSSLVKENHENFCKNASYHDFDTESSKEILKPFPELRGVIAICIGCSVVFNDIRTLKKHVLEHKSNKDSKQKEDKTSVNGPNSIDDILLSEDELPATPLPLDSLEGTSALNQQSKIISHNEEVEDVSDDSFSVLRDNFSQLFRILINDAELMKSLGFGVLQIDDVLISVLQQMGQSTVEKEDEESEIECFRKNIRIFLDFCLKDQVMELIGSETASVDDIVVEALKTFTDEEVTAS